MNQPFKGVRQVGIVVHDIEETVRRYTESLGFGPWFRYEITRDAAAAYKLTIRGRPAVFGLKVAKAVVGGMEHEFIQPTDDESIHAEFLLRHGPGIHHLQYVPEDYDRAIDEMGRRGFPVLCSGETPRGDRFCYFATEGPLGILMEVANYRSTP
jgi:catechol 2,3-dioxygenase-like lactoylglutathione lyase family enzyme